jgi:hypothetical protein
MIHAERLLVQFPIISFKFFFEIILPAALWLVTITSKGKGKAIPLRAWTGPDGSRRLRLPDFKTIGT